MRNAEMDEAQGWLPTLERAAAASAALAAEARLADLLTERPTALPGEVLPGPTLDHAAGCPDPARIEVTHPSVGRNSQGAVLRCISCQAHRVLFLPPREAADIEAADIEAAAPGPALLRRPEAGEQPVARDGWEG